LSARETGARACGRLGHPPNSQGLTTDKEVEELKAMSNPICAVCGHTNRVGAEVCEMCDARLGGAAEAGRPFEQPRSAPGEEPREGALPTDIPLPQFKGAGDVIGPTLDVYKKNFLLVGLLVLVTTLPLVLLQYASARAFVSAIPPGASMAPVLTVALLSGLLALVAKSVLEGALIRGVVELQRAGSARAGDCLRWGLKKMPKVALVNVLYGLVVGLGFLLLVVPGIIFSLMFAVVVPVVVVENRGIVEAFERSSSLTKGYKGLLFLTYFLWWLLIMVVSLIVGGSFALGGAPGSVFITLLQSLISEMLGTTTTVLTVFIFLGLLNERRHGFDTRTFTPAPADAAR
jgi:hypothetical protein